MSDVSGVYLTSFCNQGHNLVTGVPIKHECFKLPPKALEAEQEGDVQRSIELIETAKPLRQHSGKTRKRAVT